MSTTADNLRHISAANAMKMPHDIVTYPEAGHSFMTRTTGIAGRIGPLLPMHVEYHEPSARDGHRRIVAFFHEHLDGQDGNHE